MLASSNHQYLRPEYLNPLPTNPETFKVSPLVLLAKTCSQIGAENPKLPSSVHQHDNSSSSSSVNSSSSSTSSNGGGGGSSNKKSKSSSSLQSKASANVNRDRDRESSSSSKSIDLSIDVGGQFNLKPNLPSNASSLSSSGRGQSKSPIKRSSSSPSTKAVKSKVNGKSNSGGLDDKTSSNSSTISVGAAEKSGFNCSSTITVKGEKDGAERGSKGNTPNTGNPGGNASLNLPTSASSSSRDTANKSPSIVSSSALEPSSSYSEDGTADTNASRIHESLSNSDGGGGGGEANTNKLNLTDHNDLSSMTRGNISFPGLYSLSHNHHHHINSSSSTSSPIASSPSTGTGIPPYLHSYARLKAAAASISASDHSLIPPPSQPSSLCGDTYCNGCPSSLCSSTNPSSTGVHQHQHLAKSCPFGCIHCDHQKIPLSSSNSTSISSSSSNPGIGFGLNGYSQPSPSLFSPLSFGYGLGGSAGSALQPYVCNWILGESGFCGKRFSTSEDLLVHLRSHSHEAYQLFGYPSLPHHPLLSHSLSHLNMSLNMSLNRSYQPSLSDPLSSGRFHPYSKPASSFLGNLSNFNHSLGNYYPFSLYGQNRLGE